MLTNDNIITISILTVVCIVLFWLLKHTLFRKGSVQLRKAFATIFTLLFFWIFCLILQIIGANLFGINPIYFEYCVYISSCFLPVVFFLMALIFSRTKIQFKKWYLLLFIIPITSLVVLWTNSLHHLFYKVYSTSFVDTVYGNYFYVHTYYTYLLYGISLFILIKYSVRNSGFFSKPAILIVIGALTPIVVNVLATFSIIPMSVYITPITFAITAICLSLAMFRFSILKAAPIALQRIVDRISDSYIILDENNIVTDFNATFLNTFNVKSSDIRNSSIFDLASSLESIIDLDVLKSTLNKVKSSSAPAYFDKYFPSFDKYFRIEINTITSNNAFLGTLILFKDTTQHEQDMLTIRNNQDTLMENERLASLGQLIGGIAHNLKTPIMSISGAAEGLNDLITEYDSSIDNPQVTAQDHHEIAHDMSIWIDKIRSYTEYMSDVITAVKGQAVTLATDEEIEFTIEELIKRVDILMKHELKNAIIYLNISMRTDEKLTIHGDANSLVQVINNMISNSIQAYNGKPEQKIDMVFSVEDNNLVITIQDYAGGLPEKVKEKLFKEMITTKGKNGTGLGLYMSYSNIRARFNGDITFSTNNEGTTFKIILPL